MDLVITMGLVVPKPESLGGPTGTLTEVCSNPSIIKYKQSKPYHFRDGEESTYIFSIGVHKQRPCMPMAPRTTKEKIRTSYRPQLSPYGKITKMLHFCVHYFVKAYNAPKNDKILKIMR